MASTVAVNMRTCGKSHRITVSMRDDGDMDVSIESDCANVREYAKALTRISMSDIMDRRGSRILDPEASAPLSATCLTHSGVMSAAWMEAGMLSKSLCAKAGRNEVSFEPGAPE
ncbi:MAG: hypothetical protein LBG62_02285 [Candidatus Methanoplasma sp.]|jgi:hypothetical protein|nr:hypothetical protein [Candidatus Methanoplasma sp.]